MRRQRVLPRRTDEPVEGNDLHFVLGLARNPHPVAQIAGERAEAEAVHKATGRAGRAFTDFSWSTFDSQCAEHRVKAMAEWTHGEATPRFVVTSLHADVIDAARLQERVQCWRSEMENRIKMCQLDLYADRLPTATMRASQTRLWLAAGPTC